MQKYWLSKCDKSNKMFAKEKSSSKNYIVGLLQYIKRRVHKLQYIVEKRAHKIIVGGEKCERKYRCKYSSIALFLISIFCVFFKTQNSQSEHRLLLCIYEAQQLYFISDLNISLVVSMWESQKRKFFMLLDMESDDKKQS